MDRWTNVRKNSTGICVFVPVSHASQSPSHDINLATDLVLTPVILDRGILDGVRRVLFGSGFEFWLHRVLFLDALSFLSRGQLSQPLDRFILVDIDDIFVARSGLRLTQEDVAVLTSLFVCTRLLIRKTILFIYLFT